MKFLLLSFFILIITGCQLLPENTKLRSYRVLVQQGNIIDENKVEALKINMTKEQESKFIKILKKKVTTLLLNQHDQHSMIKRINFFL